MCAINLCISHGLQYGQLAGFVDLTTAAYINQQCDFHVIELRCEISGAIDCKEDHILSS